MSDEVQLRASRVARAGRRSHDPMLGLTLKTALAAGIAWQLGVMLPAYLPTYSFYAPLGALTVMYSALYDSAISGLRALAAVTIGVLVSVLLHLVDGPNAITVAVALGVGMVLGNIRKLGEQGSWAPMAALFVFTAGRANTLEYVVGYLSQLALGAIVGFVINGIVFPPLALHGVERAMRAVRRDIVRLLDQVVDLLDAAPDAVDECAENVRDVLATLPETRQQLRQAMSQAERAQHGNPRRRRWRTSSADVLALAGAAEAAASLVEDLARELLEEREPLSRSDTSSLAAATASLRDVFDQSRGGVPDEELVQQTHGLLDEVLFDEVPFVVRRAIGGLQRCLRIETSWTE